jgi:hypothetical protein
MVTDGRYDQGQQGEIGPLTLPTLLQGLCGAQQTGTLTLMDGSITKTLYFESGRVVFAASTDPEDRLGQLYFKRGMITISALKEAVAASVEESRRMGTILVRIKAIRPQDLIWGVTEQVRMMILSVFAWTRGTYLFEPGPLPSNEVITLKVPTPDLVMSGVKSIDSWSRVEAAVGDTGTRYHSSPRHDELARELNLSLDEWSLLSLCESGATLGQMCGESPLPDFEICRLIWGFMVVGLLVKQEAVLTASAG